jgi:hypothetical protein
MPSLKTAFEFCPSFDRGPALRRRDWFWFLSHDRSRREFFVIELARNSPVRVWQQVEAL